MREEDNRHYTAVKPPLGLIGWEMLLIGGVGGYQFCQHTDRHWLYGVLIALAIAGVFFALIAQPLVRKLLFVAVSLAAGTFFALLLMMWADTVISVTVGLLAGAVV